MDQDDHLESNSGASDASPARQPDAQLRDLSDGQEPSVDVALNLIVAMAVTTIRGADGVSITLGQRTDFSTVAASDQKVYSMDGDQYELGEGPCLSAARRGQRFHAPRMDEELRWPAFTARASERGINAILSSPLILDDGVQGALNVYSTHSWAFGGSERATASAFAAQASVVLKAAARGDSSGSALSAGFQEMLQQREVEAFAKSLVTWTSLTAPDKLP